MRTVLLVLALAATAPARVPAAAPVCDTSDVAHAAFARLAEPPDASLTSGERRARREAILRAALAEAPRDEALHERLQDLELERGRAAVVVEYEALLAKSPDDPLALWLAGRALVGKDTPRAVEYLRRAVALQPAAARPHLALAEIALTPAFAGPERAREELAAVGRLCPSLLSTTAWVGSGGDAALVAGEAARLRRAIGDRRDVDAVAAYPKVWRLESSVATGPAERDAFMARLAADVTRLRAADVARDRVWYGVMSSAAGLLDDRSLERGTAVEVAKLYPRSAIAASAESAEWFAVHPFMDGSAPEADRRAYAADLHAFADAFARRWPGSTEAVFVRWLALSRFPSASSGDADAILDEVEARLRRDPDTSGFGVDFELEVASWLVEHGVRMRDVPALVEAGFRSFRASLAEGPSDLYVESEAERAQAASDEAYHYLTGYFALAGAALAANDRAAAESALAEADVRLQAARPKPGTDTSIENIYRDLAGHFWSLKGRLAESAGRKLDALVLYRNAVASYGPRNPNHDDGRDAVMAAADRLWTSLGGSTAAWNDWASTSSLDAFYAGRGDRETWTRLARAHPELELTDVRGVRWKPAELAGKTTLVAIWATWCPWCIAELPSVQQLAERLADRKDVVVISLNVDVDEDATRQFLAKRSLSLRATAGKAFAYDVFPQVGLPSVWIVGANGCETFESGAGDAWVDRAADRLAAPATK